MLLTEPFARNVGNSAVFFGNNLIMSSAHHPMITHLSEHIVDNTVAMAREHHADGSRCLCTANAAHATGPFYLNRSFAGVATLLPISYARRFDMVRDARWDAQVSAPYTMEEMAPASPQGCRF